MKFFKQNIAKPDPKVWLVLLIFATIYGLISIVNHMMFRTYGQDLGIYTHGIYMYSHFKMHWYTLGFEGEMYHLGNHFSPIMIFISPLYYLFGKFTLLIVQIGAILGGGFGMYRFAQAYITHKKLPLLIMVQFFCMWAIYSALSFDFHTNVLAAMMVPWFAYYFHKGNLRNTILFFALILLTKENMALWLIFITGGLLVKKRFDNIAKTKYRFGFVLMGISAVYFVTVQNYIMPLFDPEMASNHLSNYGALGDSLSDIFVAIIEDPIKAFSLLFESPEGKASHFGIKTELHFMVLISGGILMLYRPYYLLMLLPIYAQKMFSSNVNHWGISFQYSIEFLPIISMAIIDVLSNLTKKQAKWALGTITACTLFFTINSLEKRNAPYFDRKNTTVYYDQHYKAGINTKSIKEGLKLIPDDASVSASSNLIPHIADRVEIYHFPMDKKAEYIALITKGRSTYPFNREKFDQKVEALRKDSTFKIIFEKDEMMVLKREN